MVLVSVLGRWPIQPSPLETDEFAEAVGITANYVAVLKRPRHGECVSQVGFDLPGIRLPAGPRAAVRTLGKHMTPSGGVPSSRSNQLR